MKANSDLLKAVAGLRRGRPGWATHAHWLASYPPLPGHVTDVRKLIRDTCMHIRSETYAHTHMFVHASLRLDQV